MDVQGQLPPELTGTYFRNGPGAFEVGKQALAHPFDGAGLVSSIAICNGKAFFRSRYVDTAERKAELQQNRVLFRGTFGTQQPGLFANLLDVVPKNAANTNVLLWANKCWALFEAGQPHKLNPFTLETEGLDLLGGCLRPGVPFTLGGSKLDRLAGALLRKLGVGRHLPSGLQMGGDALTAHPQVDPATGHLVMYSYRLRLGPAVQPAESPTGLARLKSRLLDRLQLHTEVTFWEFDQDLQLVSKSQHSLPGYAFLHDFSVTQHHYVIFRNPVDLQLLPFLLGRKAAVHAVKWHPNKPLAAHLIRRPPTNPQSTSWGCHRKEQSCGWHMSPEGKTHSQCTVNRHDAVSKCDAVDRQGAVSTADAVNRPGAVQSFAAVQLDRPHANSVASKAAADGSVQHYRSSDDSSSNSDSHSSLTASSAEEGKAASVASHLLRPCTKPVMTQQTEVYKEAKMSCNPHVRLEVHSLHHSDQVPEAQQEGLFESQRAEHGCDVSQAGLGHASVHVVQGESGFVFHHANAYEASEGCVVVDAIRYPTLPDFDQACGSGRNFIQDVKPQLQPISQLWRFILDVYRGQMHAHPLSERAMEYPTVNPDLSGCPTQFVYTAAALHPTKNEPQQALVKTDAQTGQSWLWCKHERYYAGEPAFVPRQRLVKQAGAIPYEQQVEKDSPQNQHDLTSQLCGHLVPEQQQGHQLIQKQHQASSRRAQQQVGRNHPMQTQHKTQPQDTVVSAAGDEGWIVALCYDAAVHCSEFVILDAQKIESGPVAVLPLKKTIPHGLHGIWSEAYVGPSV